MALIVYVVWLSFKARKARGVQEDSMESHYKTDVQIAIVPPVGPKNVCMTDGEQQETGIHRKTKRIIIHRESKQSRNLFPQYYKQ